MPVTNDDPASLDRGFTALKTFDYGGDATSLASIDRAIVAAHADATARKDLERRLLALAADAIPPAAFSYICRALSRIGTAAAVPTLAPLLADPKRSHMARFALERIPAPEAAEAIRAAVGNVQGDLVIGMISSLGGRRDAAAVPLLASLLTAAPATAAAAAEALGRIGSPEATKALDAFASRGDAAIPAAVQAAVGDARLSCAETLLAGGRAAEALAVYRSLAKAASGKPAEKWLELAATRGIAVCLEPKAAGSPS